LVIVSASYKTDIPAFYGDWLLKRLCEGSCRVRNAYGGPERLVSLDRSSVEGFVFWTRNVEPFRDGLAEVARRGYPFVVQYTITGYGRTLESRVPEAGRTADAVKRLADAYGPRAVVWRYDPILISSQTPVSFHADQFGRLAARLQGACDEAVTSFTNFYRKTEHNLAKLAAGTNLTWEDPADETKRDTFLTLARIARENAMRLTLCAQPAFAGEALPAARCIDADRLSDVAGAPIEAAERGNRPGCACHASVDIGDYDTCPQGCVYCYAVGSRTTAQRRHRAHDAAREFLGPSNTAPLPPGTEIKQA
jgi:hypothetical protein